MKIGAATIENSMEVCQEIKNRTTIWSSNSNSKYIPSRNVDSSSQIDTCIHMFISAVFTIAKIQRQPKCPSTDR